jgi:hypothetical protein
LCSEPTSTPAFATEGGGSQYPLGVETHFSGVMAPPGYHQFLYYSHYESSHSKDNNGDDNPGSLTSRSGPMRLPRGRLTCGRTSPYSVRMWKRERQSRFRQSSCRSDRSTGPAGPLDRSGSKTGLGDLSVHPVVLGWHLPDVHQMAGIELLFPTALTTQQAPVNMVATTTDSDPPIP